MSSKPSEPRSIASQLVLLFTLAATAILGCGLFVFYIMVVRHAFEEDNVFLADKVAALSAELHNPNWRDDIGRSVQASRREAHSAYWVRLLDPDGQVAAETAGMGPLLPPALFPTAETSPANLRPTDQHVGGKLFSLVSIQHAVDGQTYTLQMAQDRSEDEDFRREFGLLLVVGIAAGTLVSVGIAVPVTRKALQPLTKMRQLLERVGPAHLAERLNPSSWPRELKPLAAAFDEMLHRLEDSFTRLSQFSADLAHELRTPVSNMLGEAQVTLTRPRTPEEYREALESSAAECQRLTGIIDNLLFLARAEAGRGGLQPVSLDGAAAAHKIANYYEAAAEEQSVTISVTGEERLRADPMLFDRALSNLIENALRFTPAQGRIEVRLDRDQGEVRVVVSDTGSGIPAEHLPRVFDRFYRVDASRSSQGSGLGLSLVNSIMKLHGGRAQIASAAGHGTTVTLLFPAAAPGLA